MTSIEQTKNGMQLKPEIEVKFDRFFDEMKHLSGYGLRTFFISCFAMCVIASSMTAAANYWIADTDSISKGTVAALLGFASVGGLGFVLAVYRAVIFTLARALDRLGLGKMIFDEIFKLEGGELSEASVKPKQARAMFHRAANKGFKVVNDELKAKNVNFFIRVAFWGIQRVVRIFLWFTIRRIVSRAKEGRGRSARVDIQKLRDSSGDRVNEFVVNFVRKELRPITRNLMMYAVIMALLTAMIISRIPNGWVPG